MLTGDVWGSVGAGGALLLVMSGAGPALAPPGIFSPRSDAQ